jgi:hypothetical protein
MSAIPWSVFQIDNMAYVTTTVVVPQSFGTTETFQQGIRSQHHLPYALDTTVSACIRRYRSNVLHDSLRRFGFSSTAFARNDDTLILLVTVHIIVGGFGDSEDVRWDFKSILATV